MTDFIFLLGIIGGCLFMFLGLVLAILIAVTIVTDIKV